jgi:methionyl-tRNA synthetase
MMGNWYGWYGGWSNMMNQWTANNGVFNFGGSFVAGMTFSLLILVLAIWTLYWKYRALWHAAKHEHKVWFGALLIVNTLGILEILYLYVFSKYHKS